jgi:hypothetical protein
MNIAALLVSMRELSFDRGHLNGSPQRARDHRHGYDRNPLRSLAAVHGEGISRLGCVPSEGPQVDDVRPGAADSVAGELHT